MILHGENLIIMADGVALAASKSCTINVKANTLDVSSDNDGDWEHHIPGRKSWDVSTSHLFVTEENAAVLKNSIRKVGVSFTLQFTVIGDTSDTMTGTATCIQFSVTGTKNSLATGSFKWKGTGPLE